MARLAFAAAVGMLTLLLLAGSTGRLVGLMPAVSLQIAALVASYIAAGAENRAIAEDESIGVEYAAKAMALGAAHNTMLSRFSGRSNVGESV